MVSSNKFGALTIVLFFTAIGCSSISEDGKEWTETPEAAGDEALQVKDDSGELGTTAQALTMAPNKACSCSTGSVRDTLLVSDSWTRTMCRDYCVVLGTTHSQVMCILTSNWSLGSNSAVSQIPSQPLTNCGW